jgi:hypothetical protein
MSILVEYNFELNLDFDKCVAKAKSFLPSN